MIRTDKPVRSPDNWNVILHDRYIKDLSFENPGAPVVPHKDELHLNVSVRVDSRHHSVDESGESDEFHEFHEVTLTVEVTGHHHSRVVFLVELMYAGLFELTGLEEEPRQRFLLCEAPRMLFPWVNRIFADLTRDGGLPTLNLSPPDFVTRYEQLMEEVGE